MKYIIRVLVPGTKNLDYQADRLPAYTAEFTEAEKNDVLSQLDTLAPQVLQVRDLWNVNRPGNESTIEIRPLYDSQDAVVDTVSFMPDSSLKLVPVEAIAAAPLTDTQKKTAYERLGQMEIDSLPQEIQDILPDIVGA